MFMRKALASLLFMGALTTLAFFAGAGLARRRPECRRRLRVPVRRQGHDLPPDGVGHEPEGDAERRRVFARVAPRERRHHRPLPIGAAVRRPAGSVRFRGSEGTILP